MITDANTPEQDPVDQEPQEPTLKIRVDAPSGTIILNRPAALNSISRQMLTELIEAFQDFHQSSSVRSVIVTASGTTFSSGTDLKELHEKVGNDKFLAQWMADVEQWREFIEVLWRFPKPVITAVQGPVLGNGAILLLCSDIVIGCKKASFGLPEPRIGLVSGLAAPLLAFRLGGGQAARLLMSGMSISGDEAYRIGLFHELVGDDLTWARANEVAKECAKNSREAIQMTKRLLNETIGEALETFQAIGAASLAAARTTDAAAEGVAAYFEDRPPNWVKKS